MARSQNSFNKKEKEKKRLQKRKDKQRRKEERKASAESSDHSLESMMAYVDENGNILDTPPDPSVKKEEIKASAIEIGIPKKEEEDQKFERRGRVTYYDASKGYGFINQDGTQERFFVHSNNVKMQIKEGDRVSFTAKKGLKGMDAIDVRVLK